jgi:hypothetical protein
MLAKARAHLTFANIISLTALFIALGGVAWAAATINSKDVVDNSLKSVDLKDGKAVKAADVAPGELVAPGSEGWQAADLHNSPNACNWSNSDPGTDAAYFRDAAGVVHLKGLVKASDGTDLACGDFVVVDRHILSLPAGYAPDERWVFPTLSNNSPGRVDVEANSGIVGIEPGFPAFANAKVSVSLDGISFRCGPSGQDGCP